MTINFNLRLSSSSSEKPIHMIIRLNGKTYIYNTKETVLSRDWNKSRQRTKSNQELNNRLDYIYMTSKEAFRQFLHNHKYKAPTPQQAKQMLHLEFNKELVRDSKHNILAYIKKYRKLIMKNNTKTYEAYDQLANCIREFNRDLLFTDVTMNEYYKLIEFLEVKKNYKLNSIGKIIKCLKVVFRASHEEDIHTNTVYTHRRFKVPKENVFNVYLNDKELDEISKLNLLGDIDKVRDLFLLASFTGLRVSDVRNIKLSDIHEEHIEMLTKKTKKRVVLPFTHRIVKAIKKKYSHNPNSLPYLDNQFFKSNKHNKYIKDICSKVDSLHIDIHKQYTKGGHIVKEVNPKYNMISFHTARRSFISNLVLQGIPIVDIMKCSGHSKTESLLQYVKVKPLDSIKSIQNLHKSA